MMWWDLPLVRTILELFAIVCLLMLNGVFAFAEIAIVSSKTLRLEKMAETSKGAAVALRMAEDPSNLLSTVQVGITLIGILAGALSGATLAEEVAIGLRYVPFVAPYADVAAFVLVVSLVTYLSLVIGELLPKSIALNNPEQGAAAVAQPLYQLSRIALPLVKILSYSTETLLHWLGQQKTDSLPVTEDELKALVAEGAEAGVFEPMEQRLVEQALALDDISLRPLVTHRVQVDWLDLADSPAEIRAKIAAYEHTWFPVCDGGLDQVIGVARARDILLALAAQADSTTADGDKINLHDLVYPPLFVPLTTTPVRVLEMFRSIHAHVAFAVDEYGGVEGIVTPFDILEVLVGKLESDSQGEYNNGAATGKLPLKH